MMHVGEEIGTVCKNCTSEASENFLKIFLKNYLRQKYYFSLQVKTSNAIFSKKIQ